MCLQLGDESRAFWYQLVITFIRKQPPIVDGKTMKRRFCPQQGVSANVTDAKMDTRCHILIEHIVGDDPYPLGGKPNKLIT